MSSEERLAELLSSDHQQLSGRYNPSRLARRVVRRGYLKNSAKVLLLVLGAWLGLVVSLDSVRTLLSLQGALDGSSTVSVLIAFVAYGLPLAIAVAVALFLAQND